MLPRMSFTLSQLDNLSNLHSWGTISSDWRPTVAAGTVAPLGSTNKFAFSCMKCNLPREIYRIVESYDTDLHIVLKIVWYSFY